MAVFASRAGLDMLHVPYKGGTALVAAVLSGEVQSGWSGIPNVLAHIRAGKLRVYAISTAQRSGTLPDVPTAAELGYPGFDIATVIGLQAPAGTPREVVARLQTAVAKILRERDVAERMANLAMELRENGTEDYVRFVKEDMERYSAAVKTAGVHSMTELDRIRTDVVGSLLRPRAWKDARRARDGARLDVERRLRRASSSTACASTSGAAGSHRPRRRDRRRGQPAQFPGQLRPRRLRLRHRRRGPRASTRAAPPAGTPLARFDMPDLAGHRHAGGASAPGRRDG